MLDTFDLKRFDYDVFESDELISFASLYESSDLDTSGDLFDLEGPNDLFNSIFGIDGLPNLEGSGSLLMDFEPVDGSDPSSSDRCFELFNSENPDGAFGRAGQKSLITELDDLLSLTDSVGSAAFKEHQASFVDYNFDPVIASTQNAISISKQCDWYHAAALPVPDTVDLSQSGRLELELIAQIVCLCWYRTLNRLMQIEQSPAASTKLRAPAGEDAGTLIGTVWTAMETGILLGSSIRPEGIESMRHEHSLGAHLMYTTFQGAADVRVGSFTPNELHSKALMQVKCHYTSTAHRLRLLCTRHLQRLCRR